MTEQIHNLYISSTNKSPNDKNYNYNLYFSNYGINIKEDEEAYINITSFQSLNTFYNINALSSVFNVKFTNLTTSVSYDYDFEIEEGNYDMLSFMAEVNAQCVDYFTMAYNEKKNKFTYVSNATNEYEVYLRPTIHNYKYFGLDPDVYTTLPYLYSGNTLYSNIINMNNFSLIVIKVIGLIEQNKTLDNFNNHISRGDIGAIVNRQDTAVNALINWCDINKAFHKKISNTEINHLNFIFTDEYNNLLLDLNDWLITLSIIIRKKS